MLGVTTCSLVVVASPVNRRAKGDNSAKKTHRKDSGPVVRVQREGPLCSLVEGILVRVLKAMTKVVSEPFTNT